MGDAPPSGHGLRRASLHVAGILALAACIRVAYGPGYLGVDAMWSLAWGRDLAHLAALTESGTTTPHVLSTLLGLALTPFGSGADRALIALEYLAAAALVWAVAGTARSLAGLPAGIAAAIMMLTREQLLFATRGGFLDVLAAALVAAAMWCVVRRRGASYGGAAVLLALAGLLRPEPWVVLAALTAWRWWRTRRPDPLLLGLAVAVPVLWAGADLVLTGDALFSLHETRRVSDLFRIGQHIPFGLGEQLSSIPRTVVRTPGIGPFVVGFLVIVLVAAPGIAGEERRRRWLGAAAEDAALLEVLRVLAAAAGLLAATLAGEALIGTLLFARFALPLAAVAIVLVAAVGTLVLQHRFGDAGVPAVAALTLGIVLLALPWVVHARRTTSPEHDRYVAARTAIGAPVPCTPVVVPGVNLRPFAAVWTGLRADQVRAAALDGVPARGTFIDAVSPDAAKLALDPSFPQRRLRWERAPVVRLTNGWIIRARCAR